MYNAAIVDDELQTVLIRAVADRLTLITVPIPPKRGLQKS
ncbi:hypothetical protein JOC55_004749 [Paenibacillus sacheonensis]|nr:hypothetical protein [Paenibacillus sacheonensis]